MTTAPKWTNRECFRPEEVRKSHRKVVPGATRMGNGVELYQKQVTFPRRQQCQQDQPRQVPRLHQGEFTHLQLRLLVRITTLVL